MTNKLKQLLSSFETPLVIAEIAQAHDGSLGNAHAYIDAVADAGAGAVKFQTHIAAAESTPDEPWRVKFSPQDETRFDYWKRMQFTAEQWTGLASHARARGLLFLSTPFSVEAIQLLENVGMRAWKVGSGEVTNLPLLDRMARTGSPVLISSGMATWAELDAAASVMREHEADFAMFQCTTSYPCPPEKIGLNVLEELRTRYKCPVGLSDHSGTIYPGLAAAALGTEFIEVHVVFSRQCFGPDTASSITTKELRLLADGVKFITKMHVNPISKDRVAVELEHLKSTFEKSIVFCRTLRAGQQLALDDLSMKKPGKGIPAARLREFVGRTLRRHVFANNLLKEDDVE